MSARTGFVYATGRKGSVFRDVIEPVEPDPDRFSEPTTEPRIVPEGSEAEDVSRRLFADDYHLYITNLPREEFLPADLATLYRCRWEVETFFRELKTQYDLDEFDTSNPIVMEILLYAALLSLLVSRELLDLVTEQAHDDIVFPPERWAATFRSYAQLILHELGEYLGYSPPPLLERLIDDTQKIHKQRPILQETLATAT